jgi:hypothetical protein
MISGDLRCDDARERTIAMISDRELWACANHYVSQHGDDAPIVAGNRADELLAQGDLDGFRTFLSNVRRIEVLLEGRTGRLN